MTLIDKAEALAACPFCGGENAHVFPTRRGDKHRLYPFVRCMGCYLDLPGENDDYSPEGRTAITAWNRRAALPARGVGVKPLVWLEDKDRDSETFGGLIASPMKGFRYVILQVHGGAWKLTGSVPFGLPHSPTLEAAKAAAQADYEARILAALAPTDAAQDDDPECTDCGGTGITYQTERRCSCQPTDASQAREAALREAAAAVRARYMGDNNREDQEVLRCEAAIIAMIGERP